MGRYWKVAGEKRKCYFYLRILPTPRRVRPEIDGEVVVKCMKSERHKTSVTDGNNQEFVLVQEFEVGRSFGKV